MMKYNFPWIAFAIGLTISLSILFMNPLATDAIRKLPLLTALLMSEFGSLVNAIAAGIVIRDYFSGSINKFGLIALPANIILAVYLAQIGFTLWPGLAAS